MNICNHEEADTRMLVHVKDALEKGARSVLVRTVDTDVVVLLIAEFRAFFTLRPDLTGWVAFGMGTISSLCQSTVSAIAWEKRNLGRYHFSMHLLGAIRRLCSWEKERNQHGKLGIRIRRPRKLFFI